MTVYVKCAERHCKRLLEFTQEELDQRLRAGDTPRCLSCFGHRRSTKQTDLEHSEPDVVRKHSSPRKDQ